MPPVAHPGRLLRRELQACALSANRLALDLGVPSGRITDILNAGPPTPHSHYRSNCEAGLGEWPLA